MSPSQDVFLLLDPHTLGGWVCVLGGGSGSLDSLRWQCVDGLSDILTVIFIVSALFSAAREIARGYGLRATVSLRAYKRIPVRETLLIKESRYEVWREFSLNVTSVQWLMCVSAKEPVATSRCNTLSGGVEKNVKWVYSRQARCSWWFNEDCIHTVPEILEPCYRNITRCFWTIKQWLVNYRNIFHSFYSYKLAGFLSCFYTVLMFWSTVVPSRRLTWWSADDTYLQNHRYIPNDMHSSFNSCSFSAAVAGRRLAGSHLWTTRPNFEHAPTPLLFLHLFFLFPPVPRSAQRWSEASQEIRP